MSAASIVGCGARGYGFLVTMSDYTLRWISVQDVTPALLMMLSNLPHKMSIDIRDPDLCKNVASI